jgi:hypothetical protein
MDSTMTLPGPSPEIMDLFDLDVRRAPVIPLPSAADSGDCTNDGCTGSCNSCGCR